MKCNRCGNITNLTKSHYLGNTNTVRRYRVCPKCGNRFFTYEVADYLMEGTDFLESFFDA